MKLSIIHDGALCEGVICEGWGAALLSAAKALGGAVLKVVGGLVHAGLRLSATLAASQYDPGIATRYLTHDLDREIQNLPPTDPKRTLLEKCRSQLEAQARQIEEVRSAVPRRFSRAFGEFYAETAGEIERKVYKNKKEQPGWLNTAKIMGATMDQVNGTMKDVGIGLRDLLEFKKLADSPKGRRIAPQVRKMMAELQAQGDPQFVALLKTAGEVLKHEKSQRPAEELSQAKGSQSATSERKK